MFLVVFSSATVLPALAINRDYSVTSASGSYYGGTWTIYDSYTDVAIQMFGNVNIPAPSGVVWDKYIETIRIDPGSGYLYEVVNLDFGSMEFAGSQSISFYTSVYCFPDQQAIGGNVVSITLNTSQGYVNINPIQSYSDLVFVAGAMSDYYYRNCLVSAFLDVSNYEIYSISIKLNTVYVKNDEGYGVGYCIPVSALSVNATTVNEYLADISSTLKDIQHGTITNEQQAVLDSLAGIDDISNTNAEESIIGVLSEGMPDVNSIADGLGNNIDTVMSEVQRLTIWNDFVSWQSLLWDNPYIYIMITLVVAFAVCAIIIYGVR